MTVVALSELSASTAADHAMTDENEEFEEGEVLEDGEINEDDDEDSKPKDLAPPPPAPRIRVPSPLHDIDYRKRRSRSPIRQHHPDEEPDIIWPETYRPMRLEHDDTRYDDRSNGARFRDFVDECTGDIDLRKRGRPPPTTNGRPDFEPVAKLARTSPPPLPPGGGMPPLHLLPRGPDGKLLPPPPFRAMAPRPLRPTGMTRPPLMPVPERINASYDEAPRPAFQPRRRLLCKFFREGNCRDLENCSFSHSAADANRGPELCRFYAESYCKKGAHCQYLHAEYPCIEFHKGKCETAKCKFSHQPLDDFSKQIVDAAISGAPLLVHNANDPMSHLTQQHAMRGATRTVLLTPISQRGALDPAEYAKVLQNGFLQFEVDAKLAKLQAQAPIPATIVPQLPPPGHVSIVSAGSNHESRTLLPAPINLSEATTATTSFTPIQPGTHSSRSGGLLSTPTNVIQSNETNITPANRMRQSRFDMPYQPQPVTSTASDLSVPKQDVNSPQPPSPPKEEAKEEPKKLDISEMLRRIRSGTTNPATTNEATKAENVKKFEQKASLLDRDPQVAAQAAASIVKIDDEIDESPASPPPVTSYLDQMRPKPVSQTRLTKLRLHVVKVFNPPNTCMPISMLDRAMSDPKLRADPRIKKALDSRFTHVPGTATTSLIVTNPQLSDPRRRRHRKALPTTDSTMLSNVGALTNVGNATLMQMNPTLGGSILDDNDDLGSLLKTSTDPPSVDIAPGGWMPILGSDTAENSNGPLVQPSNSSLPFGGMEDAPLTPLFESAAPTDPRRRRKEATAAASLNLDPRWKPVGHEETEPKKVHGLTVRKRTNV